MNFFLDFQFFFLQFNKSFYQHRFNAFAFEIEFSCFQLKFECIEARMMSTFIKIRVFAQFQSSNENRLLSFCFRNPLVRGEISNANYNICICIISIEWVATEKKIAILIRMHRNLFFPLKTTTTFIMTQRESKKATKQITKPNQMENCEW